MVHAVHPSYPHTGRMVVDVVFTQPGVTSVQMIDWNDQDAVRRFAAQADATLRAGGSVRTSCRTPFEA